MESLAATDHVLSLPVDILKAIVMRLEIPSVAGRSRDWKGLAEVIGFNARHIEYVKALQTNSHKTRIVLNVWERSGKSSIEKLIVALKYIDNIDCINILTHEPTLRELDFSKLIEKASQLKDYQERVSYFPTFTDSEVLLDDQWTTTTATGDSVPSLVHGPSSRVCVDVLTRSHGESTNSARSPEEEYPSLSATPSVAINVAPSKQRVFCSYYPDTTSTHWVKEIAGTLSANGFTVEYATPRQMRDAQYKMNAINSCYNILVLCTQRYADEYNSLLKQPSLKSNVQYDHSLIRDIFFNEQERIICVSIDQDVGHCIPQLFNSLRVYRYPSEMKELIFCVRDEPMLIAPQPQNIIPHGPIKINFPADVKKYRAIHNICEVRQHETSRHDRVKLAPQRIAPRPIPTSSKKSLFKRLLNI